MQASANYLDTETIEFKKTGVLVVRNVFSNTEIAALCNEIDFILSPSFNLSSIIQYRTFPWKDNLPERIDPLSPYSKVFEAINVDKRITVRMKKFFDTEDIRYRKDKLIFKAPGQAGYQPHQDQSWWTKFGQASITCLVAIDAADEANGGLAFLLNAHQKLLTDPQEPRYLFEQDLQPFENNKWYLPELNAGDVVFFHGLTIHKSGPNLSSAWRMGYFISYCV